MSRLSVCVQLAILCRCEPVKSDNQLQVKAQTRNASVSSLVSSTFENQAITERSLNYQSFIIKLRNLLLVPVCRCGGPCRISNTEPASHRSVIIRVLLLLLRADLHACSCFRRVAKEGLPPSIAVVLNYGEYQTLVRKDGSFVM